MRHLLDDLNPAQREAVIHTEGPLLVLAGAGTGKTRVITYRIAYLLSKGVSPKNILGITFTNKAAEEMKKRIYQIASAYSKYVWISTFHSFAARILRIEAANVDKNFVVFDETDQKNVIKECIKELNINEKKFKVGMILDAIQRSKDNLIDAESYSIYANVKDDSIRKTIAKVYLLYQKKLESTNALDFGDLLLKVADMFYNFPTLKEKYQNRFKYVLVDEYQDTNRAQHLLIKHIVAKHRNICVVGDDDQAIYSWRGANVKNILEFEKEYPNVKIVRLEQNYRSTKNILDCAYSVIRNNIHRKEKKLWTARPGGKNVEFHRFKNEFEEAEFTAEKIKELCSENNNLQYKDFAVFYRTNAQSRVFEDAFRKAKIPYVLVGTVRFYERKEIKDIVSYLRFLFNPKDELSLKRIVNVPRRGIGKETIKKLDEYARKHRVTLWEVLQKQNKPNIQDFVTLIEKLKSQKDIFGPVEFVKLLLEETGYIEELKLEDTYQAKERINNLAEFVSAVKEYIDLNPDANLEMFLQNVALMTDIDSYNLDKSEINAVTLMTVHLAKGLEFDTVFLTGLEEGLFPIVGDSLLDENLKEVEEERRLCYVGITRAKNGLYITYAESRILYGEKMINIPSRFFEEARQVSQFAELEISNNCYLNEKKSVRFAGQRVRHPEFGTGTILKFVGNHQNPKLVVKFDNYGIKTLAIKYANLESE